MISIQEALRLIQTHLPEKRVETVLMEQSPGRIVAEAVRAPEPSPRYTNSAMDGFAIRWLDVAGVREGAEVELPVIGESRAGEPFRDRVPPGRAVRINTGAMIPPGTDCVVPVEEVEERGVRIRILKEVKKNQHVRMRGEEFSTGATVLEPGNQITPAGVGLLAALGIERVPVFCPPPVSVIVTGTELVTHSEDLKPWQIRDSNGPMLSSAVRFSGGEVVALTHCSDDLINTRQQIRESAAKAQILILSGGVSVGPHDLVKEAAGQEGFDTLFWRVNQKPGKPLFFARKDDTLLFGLPGNPVSALNCYVYYIHPVLQQLQGREFHWQTTSGTLREPVANSGKRNLFLRVQVHPLTGEQVQVEPVSTQGSHMLTSLVRADGFILLSPRESKSEGERVQVYLYPWRRK